MNLVSKKKILYILICFFFIISACGTNDRLIKKPEKIPDLNILYQSAFDFYKNGDWNKAIELFEKVETHYSYTEWAPRASLMIIYIYYEGSESYKTLENIKKFKINYPSNKYMDYLDFIKGLTFYEQINVVSKDQTYTEQALVEFKNILRNYPNSIYVDEVKYKIDLINEQLAGKHMYIARFYIKKSKWISAIKRLKIIVEEYDTTIFSQEALHRLVEIYYKLGNINEAKKYASILGYNFNDSDWYKKSYKIIGDKDYSIEEKKQKLKLRDRIKNLFNIPE